MKSKREVVEVEDRSRGNGSKNDREPMHADP
jgi:hypothetical protein